MNKGGALTATSANKSLKNGARNYLMQQNASSPDSQNRQPYNSIQGINGQQQLTINSNNSPEGAININPYQSQTSTNNE